MLDENTAKTFLKHLEDIFSPQYGEIADKPEIMSEELRKEFGNNSVRIEQIITALLFSKVGTRFERKEASFSDCVQYAKAYGREVEPPAKLDAIDIRIINSLRKDARKPVLEISKEIGLSRPTVTNRLNRLLDSKVLSLSANLNLNKLNFETSLIGLKIGDPEARQKIEKILAVCPRALITMGPTDKTNMLVLVYGEEMNTLNSTADCLLNIFKSIKNVDIVYNHKCDPPLSAASFHLKVFPTKGDITSCGKRCEECLRYRVGQCYGCPAVKAYKGPL